MIEAKRAPVRPRGFPLQNLQSTAPLLLEEEIRSFVEASARGNIAILGLSGSGKTTVLEHLAATLPTTYPIALLDEPQLSQLADAPDGLVIFTARSDTLANHLAVDGQASSALNVFRFLNNHLAVFGLVPWTQDDLIEYLLAVHRPRCTSVMARVRGEDHLLLDGLPELWRITLDRLAADETLPDVRRALHRHLQDHLTDTDVLERARSACLNVLVTPETSLADAVTAIARPGFADSLIRTLRHPPMQRMLAAERVAADLHGEAACDYLAKRLPRDLVEAAGRLIAEDDRAREHLHVLLAGPAWSHAMAVSLLHAAGASASLRKNCPTQLAGAYLSQASWSGVQLPEADLRETDLSAADLRHAYLVGANARKAVLHQAQMMAACLNQLVAEEADLSDTLLTACQAVSANFHAANLQRADFTRARLGANFTAADLTGANFHGASLAGANLSSSIIKGANFTEANLSEAILSGLCLREAHWEGARFTEAQMKGCDLEGMTLPAADFEEANLEDALLTGSTMVGANFRGANLRDAGLADIEWEGADLSHADLRGASFHMGSTRSGLVGSTIPCEGSKTGFYTDDYDEQTYKAPEEIRKASLCNADLRGAILDGVDFYLVDLRGALYDEEAEEHLRRCGAILEARS
jgi:uncharacterized protein YjbI with pentapeptide repeats